VGSWAEALQEEKGAGIQMSRCIVNYVSRGREDYPKGQERLQSCLRRGLGANDGQLLLAYGLPPYSPSHEKSPYAFKYFAMKAAFAMGFEYAMWLDASVVPLKSMEPLWQILKERGVLVFKNPGCPENYFTSEDALNELGCSLEEAAKIEQICGGVVGFRCDSLLFQKMLLLATDGTAFRGGSNTSSDPKFKGHRHDQSCLSYLVHKYQIRKEPFEALSYSSGVTDKTILELRGIV